MIRRSVALFFFCFVSLIYFFTDAAQLPFVRGVFEPLQQRDGLIVDEGARIAHYEKDEPFTRELEIEPLLLLAESVDVAVEKGVWQYPENSFATIQEIVVSPTEIFLLEAQRLWSIERKGGAVRLVLEAGDLIEGYPVQALLDMQLAGGILLVLDRVGDVYQYDLWADAWRLDRFDRGVGISSGHYFAAVGSGPMGHYVVDVGYQYIRRYGGMEEKVWYVPAGQVVDFVVAGDLTYLLLLDQNGQEKLIIYQDNQIKEEWALPEEWGFITQMDVSAEQLYFLGQDFLWKMDADGAYLSSVQLPRDVHQFTIYGEELFLLGEERLYFWGQDIEGRSSKEWPGERKTSADWTHLLEQFILPVQGSQLPNRSMQMPGAPRHYRMGVHQGIDFYWGRGTAVRAVADGVVIRAEWAFADPTVAQFDQWRVEIKELGMTPDRLLDRYRGRQIWVLHENGVVSRYAHLEAINSGIEVGVQVNQGDRLGWIGNSGSPASVKGVDEDVHLHFELWWEDIYLGANERPFESWLLLHQLFD